MTAEHRGDIHGGGHWKEKGKKPKDHFQDWICS